MFSQFVDFDAEECTWCPCCDCPRTGKAERQYINFGTTLVNNYLHAADANEGSGEAEARSKRRHRHGDRKQQLPKYPCRKQVWLTPAKVPHKTFNRWRWSWRKVFILWRPHNHGENNRARECNDGIDDKGLAAYAAHVTEDIVRLARVGRVVSKIGLAYPGGAVEEKRKPPYLLPELSPADGSYTRWEMQQGAVDLLHNLETAAVFI